MEQQRVRIRDIAEELGLSTATVSNVIHGKTKRVSEETEKRVLELLEKRQYIPSMAGILLARNSSKIIGVFVNDHEKYEGHTLEDVFIAASLNALSTEIEACGRFMMVKKTKNPAEILQFASMWNMEGLVVIGFCHEDYLYLRNHMRLPFVIYDGQCEKTERIVNITLDNFHGGFQVGALFRRTGHQKALCISDNEVGVDRERIEGFQAGFGAEGMEVFPVPMRKSARWERYRQEITRFRQVTAVFAVSDYYAVDLMQFLRGQGFSIPADLSLCGFDDTPMCTLVSPTLTTVRQDNALRARVALQKLQELRDGQCAGETVLLPVTLVERSSTRRAASPAG